MNIRNLLIGSIALNVLLFALIFVVKKDATSQAQEHVKKTLEKSNFQVAQIKDNIENNNLLWTLIDSIWKSSDKSVAFVKKLADSQKLPRCKGKPCVGDESRLDVAITKNSQERSVRVGWRKYSFKVFYDAKDKFVSINADDLLGKSQDAEAEETEEESAEGEE